MSDSNQDSEKSIPDIINSSSPEQVLAMLVLDLRTSADIIIACGGILSEETSKEDRIRATTEISNHGKFIYDYLEVVFRYVKKRKEQS
jgi:hypothetical protein